MHNLWYSKLGQYLLWVKEEGVETGRRDRGNYGAGNSLFLVQVYDHISMFTLVFIKPWTWCILQILQLVKILINLKIISSYPLV